ncbi:MAG TPA: zinc-binding dehydrogenase [candidate division Zixibacteria bacterium]|nr:zinc-binding dehydrogenase [candidate division Zixibacteria bacterium]
MKAVRIHEHGGVDKLRYEEAPLPAINAPNEVLVRLAAAALNHVDIWTRMGVTGIEVPMPHILGADGSGVVAEVGDRVRSVKPGDRVCLYSFTGCGGCEFCLTGRDFMCIRIRSLGSRLDGTYAEYVKTVEENCFSVPSYMSFHQAAAFPLVFITVWRMLVTNARLQPGETLLVIGIGGGIASAALQLAKKIGARVIVTSGSDAKLERARNLGADHVVHHRRTDFAEAARELTSGRGVDVVLDCVGGEVWTKSLASLARGGRLVTCGATAGAEPLDDLEAIAGKYLKIYGSTLGSREEFRRLLSFLEVARIEPIIDSVFPLSEAAAAQERMEQARQFGKIVLDIPR